MRYIVVRAGAVKNIIEYGAATPPEVDEDGDPIILESPQGSGLFVGAAYDPTSDLADRTLGKMDMLVFKELFRVSNAVRVLQGQGALTANQYKAFLKTQL